VDDKRQVAKEKKEFWRSIAKIQEEMMEEQKGWRVMPVQDGEEDWKSSPAVPEPMPRGDGKSVLPEVIKDLVARSDVGKVKYGTRLKVNNGRDALMDAYQELLDLTMYFKQMLIERDAKNENRDERLG